jgi:uncharacterized membrane protein
MSEFESGSIPPQPPPEPAASAWQSVPPPPAGYTQAPPPPPGYAYAQAAAPGLADNTAGALAYVTFIPALIFLLVAPYNQKPFIKFHAIQELGLTVFMMCLHLLLVVPILGWLGYVLGAIAATVIWVICIVKASQGGAFKIPVIGDFAAQQSGYVI